MKDQGKRYIQAGLLFILAFGIFTWLVQTVDVKPFGVNGTNIGFSSFNTLFHRVCGVHMMLYIVTDWAGLVPIFVAMGFAVFGFFQLIRRRSLLKVDADILVLGVHYLVVATLYLVFEMAEPINYRPILINGFMETSYPSSTTLLVLGVMPTLVEQIDRRCKKDAVKALLRIGTVGFSLFMVVGRLISGVHWFTDILGSVLVSMGLFCIYKGLVFMVGRKVYGEGEHWNLEKNFKT